MATRTTAKEPDTTLPMPVEQLHHVLYLLQLARYFDERMEALYRQGRLPGAIYSGRGQEGTHVGVVTALRPGDSLFPTHRDLTAQLAKGLDLKRVMAQFWGRIDGYTRGRDGNSHIGDWQGNRTFTVMSHLPVAYPVACGAALAYQRAGDDRVAMGICGDGVDLERALARVPQRLRGLPPAGRVGREQQPVRVLHAEPARVPGAHDRRARAPPTACRASAWTAGDVLAVVRGRARGRRPGPRRRGAVADRVGVAALARARGPRPRELHAVRAARALHGRARPGQELRGVDARARPDRRRRHGRAPGPDRARVRGGLRVRARLAVPRARATRSEGNWTDDGYWASEPGRGGGTEA